MPAAGSLRSSADDMIRFLAACLQPPAGSLGAALSLAQIPHARWGKGLQLGLCWIILNRPDRPQVLWHNGGTWGFRSFAGFAPRTRDRRGGHVEHRPQCRPPGTPPRGGSAASGGADRLTLAIRRVTRRQRRPHRARVAGRGGLEPPARVCPPWHRSAVVPQAEPEPGRVGVPAEMPVYPATSRPAGLSARRPGTGVW